MKIRSLEADKETMAAKLRLMEQINSTTKPCMVGLDAAHLHCMVSYLIPQDLTKPAVDWVEQDQSGRGSIKATTEASQIEYQLPASTHQEMSSSHLVLRASVSPEFLIGQVKCFERLVRNSFFRSR